MPQTHFCCPLCGLVASYVAALLKGTPTCMKCLRPLEPLAEEAPKFIVTEQPG
jgi:hypothetical protein